MFVVCLTFSFTSCCLMPFYYCCVIFILGARWENTKALQFHTIFFELTHMWLHVCVRVCGCVCGRVCVCWSTLFSLHFSFATDSSFLSRKRKSSICAAAADWSCPDTSLPLRSPVDTPNYPHVPTATATTTVATVFVLAVEQHTRFIVLSIVPVARGKLLNFSFNICWYPAYSAIGHFYDIECFQRQVNAK